MRRICKKYSWLVFVESIKKGYTWEWRNSIVVCIWKGVWDCSRVRPFNNKLRVVVVVVYWYSYHDLFYFLLYHYWEWKQGYQTNKLLTCKSDWADCWPPIVSIPITLDFLSLHNFINRLPILRYIIVRIGLEKVEGLGLGLGFQLGLGIV